MLNPLQIVLGARGLRDLGDGFVAVLLPVYLKLLGFLPFEVGALAGTALLGSALLTLAIGFVGSVNPSTSSASFFIPIEHAVLARETADAERTKAFARYSLVGGLAAAAGGLAAATPELLTRIGF